MFASKFACSRVRGLSWTAWSAATAAALVIGLPLPAQAEPWGGGVWTGAVDDVWGTKANWSQNEIPGDRLNVALFNNAGNGNTTLNLTGAVANEYVAFDTANSAAYTIGSGAVGSQTLEFVAGGRGGLRVYSTVVTNQLFNANVTLGKAASTSGTLNVFQDSTVGTLTFAGGIWNNSTSGSKTLRVYGAGDTIFGGVIANNAGSGTATTALTSSGNVTLKNNNTYTGLTTVSNGTLTLERATGSLAATTPLTFAGSGTFDLDNVGATGALGQSLGALTFTAGEGTVKTTRTENFDESLTFASLATRGVGATGSFVNGGGVNGITNGFVLTGRAAGFVDKGIFYGGSAYAAMDGTGTFVRALDYGSDANTAAVDTITASQHVKLTASATSQNTVTLLTLNLAGGGVDWTQNASQILTVPGILKSGGGAAGTISGGSALTAGGSNAELVIRTDSIDDELVINTPISGSANAAAGAGTLTKSGLGKLTLGVANTYTGLTYVNAGTVAYGVDNAISSGGVTIAGGRLDLGSFSDTVGAVTLTSGSITGTGTLTSTTGFTMNNPAAASVSAVLAGNVGLTKSEWGTLTLTGASTYTGVTRIERGVLEVTSLKNGGQPSSIGASTNAGANLTFVSGDGMPDVTLRYIGPGDSTDRLIQVGGYFNAVLDASGTGPLKFTNTGAMDTSNGTNNGSWIRLTGSNTGDNTIDFIITNGRNGMNVAKTGAGRWILTGANTFNGGATPSYKLWGGAMRIMEGTLGVTWVANGGVASPLGISTNAAGNLVVDGGTLQYIGADARGTTDRLFTLGASGGTLDASGAAGSPLSFTNAGAVSFTNTGSGARTLTLTGTNADTNTLASILGNHSATYPTSLSKTGAGVWRLSGTNTYTGTTTVSGGVLRANSGAGLPTNSPLVLSGGVLESSANVARAIGAAAGNMRMPGGTSGFSARDGAIQVAFGTLGTPTFLAWGDPDFNPAVLVLNAATANGSLEFLNTIDLDVQNRTIRVDAATATMSGVLLSAGGGLIKQGVGTLALTANNLYTGPTTVSGGVLSFRTPNSLYNADESDWTTTNLVVESGATAAFGVGGAGGFSTSQIDTLRGLATASGGFKNGSSLGFDTTGGDFAWNTVLDDPNGGANAVGLTKVGENTLTLGAVNTYTGPTRVLEGTLAYGVSDALPGGAVEVAGGTLDLGAFSGTVGAVTVSGGSLGGSGLLTSTSGFTFSNAAAVTAAGRFGGAVGLVKTGAGTTTLSGASTFTGGVAIQGGSLSVASLNYVTAGSWTDRAASNLGSPADQAAGTIAIGSGSTAGGLVYTGTGETTDRIIDLAGTTGGATIDHSGTGTLEFTSDLAVSGAGAKALTLQGSGTGQFTGLIGNGVGNVGIVKGGTGTWTLTGLNAYSGPTQVNQGTLVAGSADALGASALTVAGGVLDVGAFHVSLPSVSLTSGGITGGTGSLTSLTQFAIGLTSNVEVSAVLDGAAGLAKSGTGTLTLSKPNLYAGTTTITAGTLAYGVNDAIGPSPVVVNGGTLDMKTFSGSVPSLTLTAGGLTGTGTITSGSTIVADNAAALTASAPLAGSVGLTKSANGTLTLSGANTFSGPIAVQGGTLSVASLNYITAGSWASPAASNLGAPTNAADGTIALGSATVNSYLTYTGVGETTDRVIDLVGAGSTPQVQNTGTGPLVFTSDLTASVNGDREFIVRPGATGSITFAGKIVNAATGTTSVRIVGNAASPAIFSGANTYTGKTWVQVGVLRAEDGVGLPSANYLELNGGVFETGVNFARATGTAGGQMSLANTAGFSAFGADIAVAVGSLSTPPAVTWGSNSFSPGTFVLNAATATHAIDFKNAVSLVNAARTIQVNANTATLSGVISSTGTSGGITKSGAGVLVLSAANTYTGQTQVTGGVLRAATTGTGLPTASRLTLNGGVFETGANFERTGGTAAGNVDITGGVSGFSAVGGDISVAFGTVASPTALTWATAPFAPGTLVLNAATATHAIDFKNAINLGTSARIVQVNANAATLSGILSGAGGGLTKTGTGTLVLTGANSYTGQTLVSGGVLRATNAAGLPTGSRLTLNGGVIETGGDLARTGGTAAGNMDITGSLRGGFSARGSALQVAFGTLASPTALTWGTAPFAPGTLVLNESTADNPLTFANAINLNNAARTFEVGANTATISGALTGTGASGLTKTGAGRLVLSAVNTYAGATSVDQGTLEIGSTGTINGTSGITIGAAGRLRYDSQTALSKPTTLAGGGLFYNSVQDFSGSLIFTIGTLGGTNLNGNLGGLTIGTDRILSPGNSPGTAATTSQTWAEGGTYLFEVNSADGIPGSALGWDLITGTGSLDITASSANPFTIKLASLTLQNASGLVDDFDSSDTYAWLMAEFASPITSFDPAKFTVDTSLFTNSFTNQFFVARGDSGSIGGADTQLYVVYAVPEPGLAGAVLASLAVAGLVRAGRASRRRSAGRPARP